MELEINVQWKTEVYLSDHGYLVAKQYIDGNEESVSIAPNNIRAFVEFASKMIPIAEGIQKDTHQKSLAEAIEYFDSTEFAPDNNDDE